MVGFVFEELALAEGFTRIAGLDEVGRGCLAGPVVAAAVILDQSKPLPKGLNDSKKLTRNQREEISKEIYEHALAFAVGQVEAGEIDRINILEATKKAMLLAIERIIPSPDFLLIDALHLKNTSTNQKSIIKGDGISASIAAASVIAKVYRDELMKKYALEFPEFGFESHKGYGTKQHFTAIRKFGATRIHRKSFKGVLPDLFGN
ncbi:MAG: ribonuclease HII [Pyrinomonadaceae bacterium]